MNLQENINRIKQMMGVINEGLHDTSWQNNEGDKITLMDLLNATENIPVRNISVDELKPHLLSWDGDDDEVRKIESADLQYPILIFVNDEGKFITIIDGHHRAQKAARRGLETIKAKLIPINDLPKDIRKVFSHMGRQEEMKEGEFTEKWSEKYKKSIDCNNPKGFSQKAHCAGRHKHTEMKESELTEKCWAGYTQKGMKTMFGKEYPNCIKKKKK
jgi:hypothetical protein